MRSCGVLLPVSSLPSEYGIGCFSKEAYEFVDKLSEAGQGYWQILPLGPTSYGDSPYQSFSTYAGNPYFVDLEELMKLGLIKEAELKKFNFGKNTKKIDYEKIYNSRFKALRIAFDNAKKEFKLNAIEKNIIQAHMFPLSIVMPKYKESWIVVMADKICAMNEIVSNLKLKLVGLLLRNS